MIQATVERFGRIDVLVNNAGIIHAKASIENIAEEDFDRTLAVNLRGAFLGIKHAAPEIRKTGGSIVNTASVGALVPRRWTSVCSATKAALISLTKSAALDLSPDVRVNAVCPLAADTPFLAASAGGPDRLEAYRTAIAADAARNTPLGRLAVPEDVAAAITFLASDDARFITGVALPVDGGRSSGDTGGRVGLPDATEG